MCRAGQKVGNGGHGVVCFTDEIAFRTVFQRVADNIAGKTNQDALDGIDLSTVKVDSLDLLSMSMGSSPVRPDTTDPDTWARRRLDLLADKTKLANSLLEKMELFPFSNWIRAPYGLRDIDDANAQITLPSRCLIMQIAIQSPTGVYVDPRLFGKMDALNQSALILHEAIYRLAIEYGERNSEKTRVLNAYILSDQLEKDDAVTVSKKIVDIDFRRSGESFPYHSEIFDLKNNEHILVYGGRKYYDHVCIEPYEWPVSYNFGTSCLLWKDTEVQGFSLKADYHVHINLNGEILGGYLKRDTQFGSVKIPGNSYFSAANLSPFVGFYLQSTKKGPYTSKLITSKFSFDLECTPSIPPGSIDQTDTLSPEHFWCQTLQPTKIFNFPAEYIGYDFLKQTFSVVLSEDYQSFKKGDSISLDSEGQFISSRKRLR